MMQKIQIGSFTNLFMNHKCLNKQTSKKDGFLLVLKQHLCNPHEDE